MKHALIVAFHFPPEASSSGVLRTLKYARYLEEYGWRVTVITLKRSAYLITDPKLEEQIPKSAHVVRTRYINVKRHLAIRGRYPAILAVPDTWSGWWPWAVTAGNAAIARERPDIIYSTSPHATAHLIAGHLARRWKLPWVVDFRDPWFEDPPEPDTPAIVHWFARRLEAKVVARADHIVASTKHLKEMLVARYLRESPTKFSVIPNGYDEADFKALSEQPYAKQRQLTIVHTGSVNADFRDPRPLFRAIRTAADQGLLDVSTLSLRFIGGGTFGESAEMLQCLNETGLQQTVSFLPRVSYDEVIKELGHADIALLLQASTDTAALVPAKLYEYLRSQKPVLALVNPGASQELISETAGGWAIEPCDHKGLTAVIVEIYRLWDSGELIHKGASLHAVEQYSRQNLTGALADIFNSLTSK